MYANVSCNAFYLFFHIGSIDFSSNLRGHDCMSLPTFGLKILPLFEVVFSKLTFVVCSQ